MTKGNDWCADFPYLNQSMDQSGCADETCNREPKLLYEFKEWILGFIFFRHINFPLMMNADNIA